ncbi:MAG: hypothetical protein J1F35_03605 [Erysipelotrichales bacterium]|nr:hypothetical protein [Erysipelotrichales bacterium]
MKSMMKIHHTWLYWPIVEWQNKIIIYMCECPEIFLEEFCEENNLTFINKKYFNDKITSLGCIYTIERN